MRIRSDILLEVELNKRVKKTNKLLWLHLKGFFAAFYHMMKKLVDHFTFTLLLGWGVFVTPGHPGTPQCGAWSHFSVPSRAQVHVIAEG